MKVVASSIGSAASIYVLVAVTGYITFGNSIVGNIVSMCKNLCRHTFVRFRADTF